MLVSNVDAYVLVDTGATHACISKEFMSKFSLTPKVLSDCVMRVDTPSGSESMITKICRSIDVVIKDVCMPIAMLMLPLTDFDVVLGVNWLTKF